MFWDGTEARYAETEINNERRRLPPQETAQQFFRLFRSAFATGKNYCSSFHRFLISLRLENSRCRRRRQVRRAESRTDKHAIAISRLSRSSFLLSAVYSLVVRAIFHPRNGLGGGDPEKRGYTATTKFLSAPPLFLAVRRYRLTKRFRAVRPRRRVLTMPNNSEAFSISKYKIDSSLPSAYLI